MARLEAEHLKRMAEWQHLGSDEFYAHCTELVLRDTHANIDPPWED